MSLIDRILPKRQSNGTWFYSFLGGKYNAFKDIENLDFFLDIPELNAVINWKASAFRNARFQIVDEDDNVIEDSVPLFSNPNYFQSEGEFLRQTKLYHEIFGDEFLYIQTGLGYGIDQVKQIFTLPPQHVEIKLDFSKPFWQLKDHESIVYKIKYGDRYFYASAKDVLHLNDNRVDFNNTDEAIKKGAMLEGSSKIQSLRPVLNNIRAAYQARGSNLTESGPRGVLSNKTSDGMGAGIPMDPKEKAAIEDKLSEYGTQDGQKRHILTNLALDWTPMGFSTVHLKAFEETAAGFERICDEFGLTVDIFSREKGSTFNNKIQAERGAYQDTIIPEMNEWVASWNNRLEFKNGQRIKASYDHLYVFSDDMSVVADAMNKAAQALDRLFQAGAITKEEYLERMEYFMQ